MPTVRDARIDDAEAIGPIQIRARPAAYRGIMPDRCLDALVPPERVRITGESRLAA